jgi:hypothetical protein
VARGAKHPIDREMRWNFGDSCGTSLSLDEFLAQKEAAGVEFFAGKEPWLVGLHKLSWQTFFRVCTQEMDDLSQKAIKLVICSAPCWTRAFRASIEDCMNSDLCNLISSL